MKEIALNIAGVLSLISVPVYVVGGIYVMVSGSPGWGLVMIFVAAPIALAHAVVFDYVGEAIASKTARLGVRDDQMNDRGAKPVHRGSDLHGTPWQRDPGHTLD